MLKRLEHQRPRPLAHHETATPFVKGAHRLLRALVMISAEGVHRTEAAQGKRRNPRLGGDDDHPLPFGELQCLIGLDKRMGPGGTGGVLAEIRSSQVELHRNLPGEHVGHIRRDQKRGDMRQLGTVLDVRRLFDRADTDEAVAADHAEGGGVDLLQSSIGIRFRRRMQPQLYKTVRLLLIALFHHG